MSVKNHSQPTTGIRAFIALDLPGPAKDVLETLQEQVRRQTAPESVRWVRREGFHLTLFFLGDGIQAERVAALCAALDQVGSYGQPFTLRLGALGCFPKPRYPKVLWVGIDGETTRLKLLKEAVDLTVLPLGWEPEKRDFHPHLTLGRVKDPYGVANHNLPYGQILQPVEWSVRAVHLFRSKLSRQGAHYTKVHTAPLTGTRI